MPQFILVEIPSFRVKTMAGQSLSLSAKHMGLMSALYQYVRSGLATTDFSDLSASLLFSGAEPDTWTASNTHHGLHAEENLLLSYFQSFDAPGAYPIVDSILMSGKPCSSCMPYFTSGKQVNPGHGMGPFRARLTPRSDRNYTPIFYLARGLEADQRSALWVQLASMWSTEFPNSICSSPEVARGQMYYILGDLPWYALNDQENMTDSEIAEAVAQQGGTLAYWIGR